MPTLGDVTALLDTWYPPAYAEDWDAVGLVCGDPAADVRRVLLAVDPVAAVAAEAIESQAQLVITHHPLFLKGVHGVGADGFKGRVVHDLIMHGCGLFAAHTNADAPAGGVSESMALALGLQGVVPLEVDDPRDPDRGSGRVGTLPGPVSLRDFADHVARVLPSSAHGVRVSGEPDQRIERVALCGGAGDFLLGAARDARADVYVTSDLRHHPAGESREAGPMALVDVAHWAAEWTWLPVLAERLRGALDSVEIAVSTIPTDPWTFRVDQPLENS